MKFKKGDVLVDDRGNVLKILKIIEYAPHHVFTPYKSECKLEVLKPDHGLIIYRRTDWVYTHRKLTDLDPVERALLDYYPELSLFQKWLQFASKKVKSFLNSI